MLFLCHPIAADPQQGVTQTHSVYEGLSHFNLQVQESDSLQLKCNPFTTSVKHINYQLVSNNCLLF